MILRLVTFLPRHKIHSILEYSIFSDKDASKVYTAVIGTIALQFSAFTNKEPLAHFLIGLEPFAHSSGTLFSYALLIKPPALVQSYFFFSCFHLTNKFIPHQRRVDLLIFIEFCDGICFHQLINELDNEYDEFKVVPDSFSGKQQ